MPYGQIVLGPPGSGKTTYCRGVTQYNKLLHRPSYIVNLDPGNHNSASIFGADENDALIYDIQTNVCSLEAVMEETKLGPNGGLVYAMEYIKDQLHVIIPEIVTAATQQFNKENACDKSWDEISSQIYLLIDMPGQVELYTHSTITAEIIQALTKPTHKGGLIGLNLAAVNIIDSLACLSPTTYIATILVSLQSMINVSLPCVNVMSKMDLLKPHIENDALDLPLDYYLECTDLEHLIQYLPSNKMRRRLASAVVELVDDFSMLRYRPLDVMDGASLGIIMQDVDDANGYVFKGEACADVEKMVRTVKEAEAREMVDAFMGGAFKEVIEELDGGTRGASPN